MQLVTAYAVSHMLFGYVACGHGFGAWLKFAGRTDSVGKLEALHCAALYWVLEVPRNMHSAALYLLAGTILLQGHVIKQHV